MSRRFAFIAKACFSGALVVWIVSRANLREVLTALSNTSLGWLALAIASPVLGTALTAIRWKGLLSAQGCELPTKFLFDSCMVAKFAGQFLPSTIAGDAVRGYDSWKAGASKSVAITALLIDRLVGLWVLALFGVVALSFPHELTKRFPAIYGWIGAATIVLAICLWCVFAPSPALLAAIRKLFAKLPTRFHSFVERALVASTAYRGHTRALVRAVMLSVLLQANVVTFYYCIGRSIGLPISYGLYYLIVPIAVFVMLLPVSINGIGVRESIFVLLLGAYSVDDAHAVAFAWLEYGILLLYGMLGGIFYVLRTNAVAISPGLGAPASQSSNCDSEQATANSVLAPNS